MGESTLTCIFLVIVATAQTANIGSRTIDDFDKRQIYCGQEASFYGLEYAITGYNLMMGYPKNDGPDPGWTRKIFQLNFDEGTHTSDCSEAVPDGFTILRYISCDLDFTAEEMQSEYAIFKALKTSAEVSGSYSGFAFSASTQYQKAKRDIVQRHKVYTMADATCKVYESRLSEAEPPPLDVAFLRELKTLETSEDAEVYHKFFDTFGTHFPTNIEYGARYTHMSIMTSEQHQTLSESSYSVSAQAEYEGVFSVSGDLSLSQSEKEAAENFKNNAQVKEMTSGSLPVVSGNHLDWASRVHRSPVPIKYSLEPFTSLFTQAYFRQNSDINYSTIQAQIYKHQKTYCDYLKRQHPSMFCPLL